MESATLLSRLLLRDIFTEVGFSRSTLSQVMEVISFIWWKPFVFSIMHNMYRHKWPYRIKVNLQVT